jgi:hypothetical protein
MQRVQAVNRHPSIHLAIGTHYIAMRPAEELSIKKPRTRRGSKEHHVLLTGIA